MLKGEHVKEEALIRSCAYKAPRAEAADGVGGEVALIGGDAPGRRKARDLAEIGGCLRCEKIGRADTVPARLHRKRAALEGAEAVGVNVARVTRCQ